MKKLESELHSIELKYLPMKVLEKIMFLFTSRTAMDLPQSNTTISYLKIIKHFT